MNQPRVGLLPFYIRLYDEVVPDARAKFVPFIDTVATGLAGQGLAVQSTPICCVASEFAAAVADLEKQDIDLIVALHLAYSPSLESIDALVRTRLPLLLLDTTMDYSFGQAVDPGRVMFNHGIHGVQDLACMLRRRGRHYEIVAGHLRYSDVLPEAAEVARGAQAARKLAGLRALRIGQPFVGMGDFTVSDAALARLGVSARQILPADLADAVRSVTDAQVDTEVAADRDRYDVQAPADVHARSVRLALGVDRYLADHGFGAFSMNFLSFDSADGPVNTVPFLAAAKAMARGVGYAGEGDVLTASLVAALRAGFERTTFTEIFCPDWEGNTIFLSHMGELNPAVVAGKAALIEKPYTFSPVKSPAVLAGAVAAGPAVFVNIAPGPDDSLRLIAAPVQMLGDGTHPGMAKLIRGWMRPPCPTDRFLAEFSRLGGTHHSALVLGEHLDGVAAFARFVGLELCVIAG